jgi:hypothetical protein
MFKVDFGGGIGQQDVKVCDTTLDSEKQFTGTARALHFGEDSTGTGPSRQPQHEQEGSGEDPEWQGSYEDFQAALSGMQSPSDDGSFIENAVQELGLYDPEEDLLGWSFDEIFADNQWHEPNLTLSDDTHNFFGPQPSPTMPTAQTPLQYFLRFWPNAVLDRIVLETNRYFLQPAIISHACPL